MEEGRDKFAELSIIEQMKTLLLLVDVLKTGRINTCNLKPVGGVESYHTERTVSYTHLTLPTIA